MGVWGCSETAASRRRELSTSPALPARQAVEAFLAAGYSERQVLEIVLALAVKTLSNYANHLFHTPLDDMFTGRRWTQDA
ncbi:hypothetical protein D3C78_1271200 [compost metagenome]